MNSKKAVGLLLIFLSITLTARAQEDKIKMLDYFRGELHVTNNGISLVPTFSVNKPASILYLYMGKGKLSFEPDMRFTLEGKPWTFLFWFRYRAITTEKFSLRVGVHPALNFRTIDAVSNGIQKEVIETRRFLAAELAPSYAITKNVSMGMYYLYAYGLDDSQKNTHYVAANSSFRNINVFGDYYLNVSPQFYYLRLDDEDGTYAAAFLRFYKKDFPLAIGAIFNQTLNTVINPEDNLVWNISLEYRFGKW
ncbi:hypothetical protein E7Z59_11735 [Robertkochia marina]|uniref:DUF481 domain-containing protein n=1 Tax=Robertkochia marina TaxID=1227945 RepID=A0A4S3LYX5_9FLAO|nr:hypothetical protein E7Z59_11735 [Robertkochia marina]TRZ44175.1 hypothetical protein D3A96_09550 [Robertkochia marina]